MSELDDFKKELHEEWHEFAYDDVGDWVHVASIDLSDHRWYTDVQVITQGPSGKLYSWIYGRGLTEMQDDMWVDDGVGEEPIEVEKRVKMVEVAQYFEI